MKVISRSCFILAGLCLCLALLCLWLAGYRFNATASLPVGIYRLSADAPGKGDYAVFCLEGELAELARKRGYLQAGSCPSGLRPLLKKVAGLPGDPIPGDLAVRPVDSQGRAMPSVLPEGIVPPGRALLLAEHPGSFDSRYFGLVPLASLLKTEPVLLFNRMVKKFILNFFTEKARPLRRLTAAMNAACACAAGRWRKPAASACFATGFNNLKGELP